METMDRIKELRLAEQSARYHLERINKEISVLYRDRNSLYKQLERLEAERLKLEATLVEPKVCRPTNARGPRQPKKEVPNILAMVGGMSEAERKALLALLEG